MKIVQIVHNPTAGNSGHSKKELIEVFEGHGHVLNYVSTDWNDWENWYREDTDIICLAGGDGTVHKLGALLLRQGITGRQFPPIRLIPLGTANNIAKTLDIPKVWPNVSLRMQKTEFFDCGKIEGLKKKEFFLESVGFGIFPELIRKADKNPIQADSSSEKLHRILEIMLEVVRGYEAREAEIDCDGVSIRGKFLMVELMNIRFIGPQFELAPDADPGDGYFDLVLVPEENRSRLEQYLEKLLTGNHKIKEVRGFAKTIRVQTAKMRWHGTKLHVDDTAFADYAGGELRCSVIPRVLEFVNAGNP